MKFEVFKFEKVTSTNDIAINLIKNKRKKIGCVYAKVQTKGRGTYGRKRVSKKGNLFSSIFFPLKKSYPPFNEFSIINPIIISNVIKNFCKKKDITFKYPNDVMVNKKKICGILQEHITRNSRKFLIVGIWLNIVSNPKINTKYKATNILFETKKKPSAKKIIRLIISSYKKFFFNLSSYKYIDFKKKADLMALN